MSINNKRSYTEYTVTQPTTDFAIGFDDFDEGGKDNILVTLNGVLVESLGYAAIRKNENTVTITPAITEGTVRLTRETDIDEPFHKFTAGALFSAKSMDENFQQVRNSQQEVRDGFVFLEYNTNGIVQASKEATAQAKAATVEATASAVRAESAADTAVQAVGSLQGVVNAATTATTNANTATATANTAASQATTATTSAQNATQAANTAKQEAAAAAANANAATVDTLAATGRANEAADVVADLVVGKVRAEDVSTTVGSGAVGKNQKDLNDRGLLRLKNLNELAEINQVDGRAILVPNPLLKSSAAYTWNSSILRNKHDGIHVISPTVPSVDNQDASLVNSIYSTDKQKKEFGFKSGFGETNAEALGVWELVDKNLALKTVLNTYTMDFDHLPDTNLQLFGRRTESDGNYLYVLVKGGYGVADDFSYMSIYYTPNDGEPVLLSWFRVGDIAQDFREIFVYKNYLYVIPFSGVDKKFYIYNIIDKTQAVLVGTPPMDTTRTNGVPFVIGDVLFLHTWGSVSLVSYSLTNPEIPLRISTLSDGAIKGSGSMIAYDKRGYFWGVLYNTDVGSDSLIRYKVELDGSILDYETFSFTGVDSVRRLVFSDNKIYIGRFNGGTGVYVINIDNPTLPYLEKTYSDVSVSDIAMFDGAIVGGQNAAFSDVAVYEYNSEKDTYDKKIVSGTNGALADNHYNGIVTFKNNGSLELKLEYMDFGYDGRPTEKRKDYLLNTAAYMSAGRGAGKLLTLGKGLGDVPIEMGEADELYIKRGDKKYISITPNREITEIYSPKLIHNVRGSLEVNKGFKSEWLSTILTAISPNPTPILEFDLKDVGATSIMLEVFADKASGTKGTSAHTVYLSWNSTASVDVKSELKSSKVSAAYEAITFSTIATSEKLTVLAAMPTVTVAGIMVNIHITGSYIEATLLA